MSLRITQSSQVFSLLAMLAGVCAFPTDAPGAMPPTQTPAPATPVIKLSQPAPSAEVSAKPTPAKRPRFTIQVQAATSASAVPGMADAQISGDPQGVGPTELVRQHYPDGRLMLEREVAQDGEGNYINHGAWKVWDQNGDLVVQGTCRESQLHGRWTRIYSGDESRLFSELPYSDYEGPFHSEATFEDGMLHGSWTIADADGRKISQIDFADGHRHGTATWWYANGQKMQHMQFRNGLVAGELMHWKPTGELVTRETYVAGRKLEPHIDYYSNGQKKLEAGLLSPQLVLQSDDDWWNARLAKFGTLGTVERHGAVVTWYASGQKQSQAEYDSGHLIGQHTWWYEDGQKAAVGQFQAGRPHGDWTWFHRNGQKAVAGEYTAGAPVGEWSTWTSDGRLATRVDPLRSAPNVEVPSTLEAARPAAATNHER